MTGNLQGEVTGVGVVAFPLVAYTMLVGVTAVSLRLLILILGSLGSSGGLACLVRAAKRDGAYLVCFKGSRVYPPIANPNDLSTIHQNPP